jgi:hypothetical protein
MAPTNLYLATTRFPFTFLSSGLIQYAPQFATDIHKFSVAGTAIDYLASGEVQGSLGWDEQRKPLHDGRIQRRPARAERFTGQSGWVIPEDATSSPAPPPSPAMLTILRSYPPVHGGCERSEPVSAPTIACRMGNSFRFAIVLNAAGRREAPLAVENTDVRGSNRVDDSR